MLRGRDLRASPFFIDGNCVLFFFSLLRVVQTAIIFLHLRYCGLYKLQLNIIFNELWVVQPVLIVPAPSLLRVVQIAVEFFLMNCGLYNP